MAKGKYKRKRMIKEKQEKILLKDLNLSAKVVESLANLQITNAYEVLKADKTRVLEKGEITETDLDEAIKVVNNNKEFWLSD